MFILLFEPKVNGYALIEMSELDYRLIARSLHAYHNMPWDIRPGSVNVYSDLSGTLYLVNPTEETEELLKTTRRGFPVIFTEKPDWLDNEDVTIVYTGTWDLQYCIGSQSISFVADEYKTVGAKLRWIEDDMPYHVWHPTPFVIRVIRLLLPRYTVTEKNWCSDAPRKSWTTLTKYKVWADSHEQLVEMMSRSDDCDGRVMRRTPRSTFEAGGLHAEIIRATAPNGSNITKWVKEHLGR